MKLSLFDSTPDIDTAVANAARANELGDKEAAWEAIAPLGGEL